MSELDEMMRTKKNFVRYNLDLNEIRYAVLNVVLDSFRIHFAQWHIGHFPIDKIATLGTNPFTIDT